MAEATSNSFNFMALMAPEFAAKQQALTQQQAIAAQIMQEGSQQDDPARLANPGGLVVPTSPWGAAAKGLEKGLGGYLSFDAQQKQLETYKQLAAGMNSNLSPQAGALGNGLNNPQIASPTDALHDPQFLSDALTVGPDNAYKGYLERTKLTDLQKNVASPDTRPYLAKDTLVNTAGGFVPATSIAKGANRDPQPLKPAISGANPSAMSPQGNGGPVLLNAGSILDKNDVASRNDPVLQKQREGLMEGDQKYLNETLLPGKDAAVAANNNIGALQQAAAIANANDLTHTGPTAPERLGFIKHLNDFVSSTGGTPLETGEIANADAINKIGLRLTANMTKMLGSREAAQIFTKIQEANPNWYMQPKTLSLVSNLIKGENDTAIGKYDAGYKAARSGGLAQDAVNSYDKQNVGMQNVKKAFAASGMPGIDDPKSPEFQQLPPGTQFYDLISNSPTYGKLLTKH